jgi:hypothetical protein
MLCLRRHDEDYLRPFYEGRSRLGTVKHQMSPVSGAWALVAVLILLPSIAFASVPDPM